MKGSQIVQSVIRKTATCKDQIPKSGQTVQIPVQEAMNEDLQTNIAALFIRKNQGQYKLNPENQTDSSQQIELNRQEVTLYRLRNRFLSQLVPDRTGK